MLRAPFHKKTVRWTTHFRAFSNPPLSQPTLSSLWPELRHVIISTGAGTKNNYCTNLLDTSSTYTPATSFPLRILLLPLPLAFLQHHHVHPVLFFANWSCPIAIWLPVCLHFLFVGFKRLHFVLAGMCVLVCVCVWVCWCSYSRTRSNRAARASLQ